MASDDCVVTNFSCNPVDMTNGCSRTRTITWTAVDGCGHSTNCSQVITWTEDTTPPVVTCPPDTNTICGRTGTNFTGSAHATDDCGIVTISFTDVTTPGTCPTNYTITRTWQATDGCSNVMTCDQIIQVIANGPVFTNCPANTNLGCNPAFVPDCNSPAVGTTSDCNTTVTCSKLDVTNGCMRTRTITYTAVDGCDNTNICTQVVTWTEDTAPPTFNPQPFVCNSTNDFGCNPNELAIPHCLTSVLASDNCSGTFQPFCSGPTTTNLCPGSTTDGTRTRIVTYTAVDACGNSNVCRAVFTWKVDKTKPTLTGCPAATLNLGCNPSSIPDTNSYNVMASDACTAVTLSKTQVDATNGCNRTRTITYTATDCGGNTATCSQVVSWKEDHVGPTMVNCPAPTLDLGTNPVSVPTCGSYTVTATDGCGGSTTVTCSVVNTNDGCNRTRILTYTGFDVCSNSSSCSQVITWVQDAPPVLTVVIDDTGTNVIVSWPLTCAPFTLQQSTSIVTPSWTNVSQPVVVVDDRNTVTIPITTTNTYFRLKYP